MRTRTWFDEYSLGFTDESPIEGRRGHSLTVCNSTLLLYGGFVGDGYDGAVYGADIQRLEACVQAAADASDGEGSDRAASDDDAT